MVPLALTGCVVDADPSGDDDDDNDLSDDDTTPAPEPYGPDNSWWHAMEEDVPDDLEGSGRHEGDIAENFEFNDQFGEPVELYQFYGQVVVLDLFTGW